MPFKIVSAHREGEVQLCIVPDSWEDHGKLRWPKFYGDILAKNDSTQPQEDWLTYKCVLKRTNYQTYEEAENELAKMSNVKENYDNGDKSIQSDLTVPYQNIMNQISNIYDIQTAILDNQNKIMDRLTKMSSQIHKLQKQSTENITLNLAPALEGDTRRLSINIDSLETLDKFEKELSHPDLFKMYIDSYSVLCHTAPGSGTNCAYRLLDAVFHRPFLCQCSWSGASRGSDVKIPFKQYKNVMRFYFEMIHYWDNTCTMQDVESFFKIVFKNAIQRNLSQHKRMSTKRTRQKKRKVQQKRQNRSPTSNNSDKDVMSSDDDSPFEVDINGDDSNHKSAVEPKICYVEVVHEP